MNSILRRSFITGTASAVALGSTCNLAFAQGSSTSGNGMSKTQWMDTLFDVTTKGAGGPLQFTRFADPVYCLTSPIEWLPGPGQPQSVKVPVGFVTDLASVPRVFWSALRPDGRYAYAAIIHDYLYWTQTRPREEADEILRLSMQDFNVSSLNVAAIHRAVRTFGGIAWDTNADLRAKGEQRVLKRLPEKATITWKEWKSTPGVF